MTELELYKFINDNQIQVEWIGTELIIWIPFYLIKDFTELIGYSYLAECGIEVNLQFDCIAFNIVDLCEYFDINPESIEPKGKE
jgi:hypothetical protein